MMQPTLDYAFEIRVDYERPRRVGSGTDESQASPVFTGGTVDGPIVLGVVLAGGRDWTEAGDLIAASTTSAEVRLTLCRGKAPIRRSPRWWTAAMAPASPTGQVAR
jgi:Protein of unknown function (DUF3237)